MLSRRPPLDAISAQIAPITSPVRALPPRSGVRGPERSDSSIARSSRSAARGAAEMTEQQRERPQGGHRVRGAGADQVGRRSVHRLDQQMAIADVGAGGESEAAHQRGRHVAQDVAEEVGGHHHVPASGLADHTVGHRVDQLFFDRDLGELGGDLERAGAEDPVGHPQHVRLVHDGDAAGPTALAAPSRLLERAPRDASRRPCA